MVTTGKLKKGRSVGTLISPMGRVSQQKKRPPAPRRQSMSTPDPIAWEPQEFFPRLSPVPPRLTGVNTGKEPTVAGPISPELPSSIDGSIDVMETTSKAPQSAPLVTPATATASPPGNSAVIAQRKKTTFDVSLPPRQATDSSDLVIKDRTLVVEPSSIPVVRNAPPWLFSLLLHMLIMIIAGLLFLPGMMTRQVSLEVIFSDQTELLDDNIFEVSLKDLEHVVQPVVTPQELEMVENPLAAPDESDVELHATYWSSNQQTPEIGLALRGRDQGMKEALLAAYGGTPGTEAAVEAALQWFKRNQTRGGYWSLMGPYSNGAMSENRVAATAMALLAFQGAGHTHLRGKFTEVVSKGWSALLEYQKPDGDFWQGGIGHHRLYSQAQATIAVSELYGMTRDEQYRQPAQRAVDYAIKIQDDQGGWRYRPGQDSDTSVTGWFVMALQSARMAYLDVDSKALAKVSRYLDAASSRGGSRYGYQPNAVGDPPMTAEALLCRQYLGWPHDDPRLAKGVDYISANSIDYGDRDVYYWYYATQVLHHMDDGRWDRWNKVMRVQIPEQQLQHGKEKGSWSPAGDRWGSHGGRLFTTALSTYMLEVYYRHLPIYTDVYRFQ